MRMVVPGQIGWISRRNRSAAAFLLALSGGLG